MPQVDQSHMKDMPELLAPAGSPASFAAALAAGADAIYCALGSDFNARRMADNFDDASFAAACRAAHLLDVRVYATINVVIKHDEMHDALRLAGRALELGADALIVQDWGLMREIHAIWPEAEVHVSTQSNVHDARGVLWCADQLGATRVTLSRELSLPEIATCASTGVECEVFAHGAICVCYSGECLMSSMHGGRSGNRGQCANPCRLEFDLVDVDDGSVVSAPGNRRPLCPKDNCTIDDLAALVESGASSLKLEGRLKDPSYVYAVVSAYRSELDRIAGSSDFSSDQALLNRRLLSRVFNRGFTDAYLHGESGNGMISYDRSNNRGEEVGKVVGWRMLSGGLTRSKGARNGRDRGHAPTGSQVEILLHGDIGKGDILEIAPTGNPLITFTAPVPQDARSGDVISCIANCNAGEFDERSMVCVVRSQSALDAASRADTLQNALSIRKRGVDVNVVARLGRPFEVQISTCDGTASASASSDVVEPARTKAVTEQELIEHVGRMGGTSFEPMSISVDIDDNCGMGFSMVHRTRAQACESLESVILSPWEERAGISSRADDWERDIPTHTLANADAEICVLAPTAHHAKAALEKGATMVYASSDNLETGEWPSAIPCLDEICREADHQHIDRWIAAGTTVAVGNVSELALAAQVGVHAELLHSIPVYNEVALDFLTDAGASTLWVSPELETSEIATLAQYSTIPLGILAYGRVRTMTTEHCVLQASGKCISDCRACELRSLNLALRDGEGNVMPTVSDIHGRSRIYDARPVDLAPEVGELMHAGITRFMVDATLLSEESCASHVERLADAIERARNGQKPLVREKGAGSARLHVGIG